MDVYITMSAGDYISLKKSKILKNYAPILSSGNKAIANYDHYIRKIIIDTVTNSCSKDIYGNDEVLMIFNIPIDESCSYPANSFDGIIKVNQSTLPSAPSTPSVPAKLQTACYRGEQPCTTFIQSKRASSYISNKHRRQWNLKKPSMLYNTFKM